MKNHISFSAKLILLISLSFIFSSFSVAQSRKKVILKPSSSNALPSETVITLERPGFMTLRPAYKLILFGDGLVIYDGKKVVKNKGIVKTSVPAAKIKELLSEFQKSDFLSLKDRYALLQNCEKFERSKSEEVITSLTFNNKTKSVNHNLGCLDAPSSLNTLESKIEEIAGAQELINRDPPLSPEKIEIPEFFNSQSSLKDMIVSLETTMCYGTCPVYKLIVFGDGLVIFDGESHVKAKGVVRSKISPEKVQELLSEFQKINYLSLKEVPSDDKKCQTDNSSILTSLTLNGKTKSISHYLGCPDGPPVRDLSSQINKIVGTESWIGTE